MIRTFGKQLVSIALSFLLAVMATPFEAGAQQPAPSGWPEIRDNPRLFPQMNCNNWRRPSRYTRTPWLPRFSEPRPFPTRLLPPAAGFSRTRISPAQLSSGRRRAAVGSQR